MSHVIVTTAGRPDEVTEQRALAAAQALGVKQVTRHKRSIPQLMEVYGCDVIVAGKQRYEFYQKTMDGPFFFHPDTAAFRLKRLMNGQHDPLVEACDLKLGDSFLDTTLGLATDSLVAAYAVGSTGSITGIEIDRNVAFLTKMGLTEFEAKFPELQEAMRRINVIQESSITYLKQSADDIYDVVYMDPMFSHLIEESSSFAPLRQAGVHGSLTHEWVEEAVRVAKRRVVVKAHYLDSVFDEFGFQRIRRPNTKFHFGIIEK
ncbi:class I SAM-dependent methyltransferase [Sporosarcina aquimarina]|uniref:Class I SAM-dependent methyltransferase n=1 Tax=Sporosarcina aquimarina TaxID=114975 RepID=A0ABU4FXZ0_9BACL|nr:class I SAM-dependent methyltransferase [Sporosarcina aquimarina]MDW0109587.1 class I SAM-dependent methyltransferase [Sporosarcina aquimarina]